MYITNLTFATILMAVSASSNEYPTANTPLSIRESAERIIALSDESALEPLRTFNWVPRRREGFFSTVNVGMGLFLFGSTVADTESTYACLQYPRCVEGNQRQKERVARGRSAVYPVGFAMNGGVWLSAHFMRRHDSRVVRVIGWAFPLSFGAIQFRAAVKNIQLRNELRDASRGQP